MHVGQDDVDSIWSASPIEFDEQSVAGVSTAPWMETTWNIEDAIRVAANDVPVLYAPTATGVNHDDYHDHFDNESDAETEDGHSPMDWEMDYMSQAYEAREARRNERHPVKTFLRLRGGMQCVIDSDVESLLQSHRGPQQDNRRIYA